jgi:hypothetical protein
MHLSNSHLSFEKLKVNLKKRDENFVHLLAKNMQQRGQQSPAGLHTLQAALECAENQFAFGTESIEDLSYKLRCCSRGFAENAQG